MVHPSNIFLILPVILITSLICKFIHFEEGVRLAGLTSVIVLVIGMLDPNIPPLWNAMARFLEAFIGVFVAVGIRSFVLFMISWLNNSKKG